MCCFRADVPARFVARLRRLADEVPAWDGERPDPTVFRSLRETVGQLGEIVDESNGPAFRFPELEPRGVVGDLVLIDESNASLLDRNFPFTRSILAWRSPILGVVRDGCVVAACYSARRRDGVCEAGVDTVEPYRGRGFATAAVAAWARAVEAAGMTPRYSTSWDNAASLALAARLRLVAYADTLGLT